MKLVIKLLIVIGMFTFAVGNVHSLWAQSIGDKPAEAKPAPVEKVQPLSAIVCNTLYMVTSNGNLYTVDEQNGSATLIGNSGSDAVTDIAFAGNTLFGIQWNQFVTINPMTGNATVVGNMGFSANALAVSPTGVVYAAAGSTLITINPNTGVGTPVGDFGGGLWSDGDLAFDNNGILYGALAGHLATINLATGQATPIGPIGFGDVFGLSFLDGVLYGVRDAGQLIRIDPATGAGTLVGTNSLNQWGLATAPPCPTNGSITGIKFWDMNGNGIRDNITGSTTLEPLLDGFRFVLYNAGVPITQTVIQNANQGYLFANLPAGSYTIAEVAKPGWQQTLPANGGVHSVNLAAGQNVTGINFGNRLCPTCQSYVMGFKFNDGNANGQWDQPAEQGLGGVVIELVLNNTVIQTTTTNAAGLYYFSNVAPGAYTVRERPLPGWIQTFPVGGAGHAITVTAGNNVPNRNFGNYRCGSGKTVCISGFKFHDLNGNGIQDAGEGPLAGFNFLAWNAALNTYAGATSDSNGNFAFIVAPGDYLIFEIAPYPPNGPWSLSPGNVQAYTVSVGPGANITGNTFGNWRCQPGAICDCDVTLAGHVDQETKEYVLEVTNVGRTPTDSGTTVYLNLPKERMVSVSERGAEGWSCEATEAFAQCTLKEALQPGATATLATGIAVEELANEANYCAAVVARNDNDYKNNTTCVQSKVEGVTKADASQVTAADTTDATVVEQGADQTAAFGQKVYMPLISD